MGGDRHTLERKRKGLTGGGWGWVRWEGSVVRQCTASRVDAWHLKESPSDREATGSSLWTAPREMVCAEGARAGSVECAGAGSSEGEAVESRRGVGFGSDQPAVVRSHLPLCPPPVVKEQPGELPDEELQRERVGSWGQELGGWEAWSAEQEEEPGGKVSRLGGEQGARVHGRPYSWLVRRGRAAERWRASQV